jgi:hypothetical protein
MHPTELRHPGSFTKVWGKSGDKSETFREILRPKAGLSMTDDGGRREAETLFPSPINSTPVLRASKLHALRLRTKINHKRTNAEHCRRENSHRLRVREAFAEHGLDVTDRGGD